MAADAKLLAQIELVGDIEEWIVDATCDPDCDAYRGPNGSACARCEALCLADKLTAAHRLLPVPVEVRTEFGAWCHGEDRNDIRLDKDQFASRWRAAEWGAEQVGGYGITGFRIMRREHHVFAEGARFATAITAWAEDTEGKS